MLPSFKNLLKKTYPSASFCDVTWVILVHNLVLHVSSILVRVLVTVDSHGGVLISVTDPCPGGLDTRHTVRDTDEASLADS